MGIILYSTSRRTIKVEDVFQYNHSKNVKVNFKIKYDNVWAMKVSGEAKTFLKLITSNYIDKTLFIYTL